MRSHPWLFILLISIASAVWAETTTDTPVFVRRWGGWGTGPGHLKQPLGLAIDSSHRIYVVDAGNHRITVFTADGSFVRQWGSYGSSLGRFIEPTGIAISDAGLVHVVEARGARVQVFTPEGTLVNQWSGAEGAGAFDRAQAIAVDSNGDVYVADTGNQRIQKFTAEGALVRSWGSAGSGPGEFQDPVGVACDRAGNVYVADRLNFRIQKFTAEGVHLASWTPTPPLEPNHMVVDAAGDLHVTTHGRDALRLAASGEVLQRWTALAPGSMATNKVKGIAVDGFVFVVELGAAVSTGGFINKFGTSATATTPTWWGALKARYR